MPETLPKLGTETALLAPGSAGEFALAYVLLASQQRMYTIGKVCRAIDGENFASPSGLVVKVPKSAVRTAFPLSRAITASECHVRELAV